MAVTLEELQIKFTAQMGGLKAQLDGVKAEISGITTVATKAQSSFSGLARYAKMFLGAFVGRQLIQIGKQSLAMANEVVESEQLFEISMKGMAADARVWSTELSRTLGLNEYALRKNAGTMNVMLRSMGLGEKQAYDMATSLTELSEDMASFYNMSSEDMYYMSSEDMYSKLQSGMTGMSMPLKQIGILIDDNTLKQYAAAAGIQNTTGELTQQEKVLARYAAIMGQTSAAQGDLARTIDSPVNQMRILQNTFDSAKIAFGQAMQPIQAQVLPVLSALAQAAATAAQAIAYLMGSLGGYGATSLFAKKVTSAGTEANQNLTESLNDSAKAYKKAGGAAKQASKDAKVGLKAFDEINKITEEVTKTGGGAGGGKIDEPDVPDIGPVDGYANALVIVSEKVKAVAAAIKEFWDKLKGSLVADLVKGAWDALKGLWEDVLKPMGEWMLQNPDTVSSVLLGIGVAVATWKIGTQAGWLGGIAGGLTTIGTAIAAHPQLLALAVVAGGVAVLASELYNANKKAIETENNKRFGSIAINIDKLREAASKIGTPFTDAMQRLKTEFDSLKIAAAEVEALANRSSELVFAYNLMPQEFDEAAAQTLIDNVQEEVDSKKSLLEQAGIHAAMGLEALFEGTSVDGESILSLNKENWDKVKAEGAALGAEYLQAVKDAAFSGEITAKDKENILQLQKMFHEQLNPEVLIARGKMRRAEMEFAQAELTPETVEAFNTVLRETGVILQQHANEGGEMLIDLTVGLDMTTNPDRLNKELQTMIVEPSERALAEQKLSAQLEVEEVRATGVSSQLKKAFADELKGSKPAVDAMGKDYITAAVEKMLNTGWTLEEINTEGGQRMLGIVATTLMEEGVRGAQIPEGPIKKTMQDWLEKFRPDYQGWKQLEADYKALGLEIPNTITEAITDYEAMMAVAGSVGDLAGLIEDQLDSKTPVVERAAKKLGSQAMTSLETALRAGIITQDVYDQIILHSAYGTLDKLEEEFRLAGDTAMADLIASLIRQQSNVAQATKNIGATAMSSLEQALKDGKITTSVYNQIILAAANGTLSELATKFSSGGNTAVANLIEALLSGKAVVYTTGADTGQGYANGLRSKVGAVKAAAKLLAKSASDSMKKTNEISSPSKVTTEIGEFFGEGFAIGIANMQAQAISAASNLASMTSKALSAPDIETGGQESIIGRAVEQIMDRLNISMNVDGEQFGRVSIKTINDAQRTSGRILLEM